MMPGPLLALLLSLSSIPAAAFQATVSDPDFVVTVPRLPLVAMAKPAAAAGPASPRLAGDDGIYQVALFARRADHSVSARECAGTQLRAIVAQPGMPERDAIYRAPLNATTFLVLYRAGEAPRQALHAHLLSAAGTTHCIEAHFARRLRPGEDEDEWRQAFAGARIEEKAAPKGK